MRLVLTWNIGLFSLAVIAIAWSLDQTLDKTQAQTAAARFTGPTSSQPLALSADDSLLLVANPDNNTVTLFDVKNGNARLAEIPVGKEPNGVALSPDGTRAYVANTVDGTVSVLTINRSAPNAYYTLDHHDPGRHRALWTGADAYRPQAVCDQRALQHRVGDRHRGQLRVTRTIANVGPEPRGIAITNSGTGDDTQETVFVTQFLSLPIDGKTDGADDAKAGHVTVISAATDTVIGDIVINPLADTGFKAAGDALQRIAPPGHPGRRRLQVRHRRLSEPAQQHRHPRQVRVRAEHGRFSQWPGPLQRQHAEPAQRDRYQARARTPAQTINMHAAVNAQTNPAKRFITQPWAMAFKHKADEAYVVSAASNILVKVKVDPATGAPTVQIDPADTTRVLEIPTGKNPRGIVINSTDQTAYVMNYVSRDVTVIDLSGTGREGHRHLAIGKPARGRHARRTRCTPARNSTSPRSACSTRQRRAAPPITGRMSNNGWGSCGSCHPFGLSDNVVWIFPSGPKRTISQHTDFDQTDAARKTIRALNWSAERDEEADFELNIRAVSGGLGLIVGADGVTQEPNVANFTPLASGGRNQLKMRGVPAWDAIEAYIQTGIRAPISPLRGSTDPDIAAGRQLFTQANCQSCHGGAQWTSSRVRYNPPPDPA